MNRLSLRLVTWQKLWWSPNSTSDETAESQLITKMVVVLDLFGVDEFVAKIHLRMLGLIWKTPNEDKWSCLHLASCSLFFQVQAQTKHEENGKRLQQMDRSSTVYESLFGKEKEKIRFRVNDSPVNPWYVKDVLICVLWHRTSAFSQSFLFYYYYYYSFLNKIIWLIKEKYAELK